jgi:hypothetical protein
MLAGDNAWRGSTDAEAVRLKRHEIAERHGRGRFKYDRETACLLDLYRLAKHRYGGTLPDNKEGRDFAFVLAAVVGEPKRIRANLAEIAPWYDDDEADRLIKSVAKRRYRWKPDTLASPKWLNVSYAERQALGLKTIGAYDMPKAEREKLRRERYRPLKRAKERAWHERRRRKQGKPTRPAWLQANSASREKPWLAAGVSRSTWYRRCRETGCSCTYTVDKRDRTTCLTPPSQRLAPKPRRHASTTVTRKRKRQGRPLSLRLTEGSATRFKGKKAVRDRGRLAAAAPPQNPASVPATLTSPWGPVIGPPRGHVTVSDRLLSRPGAA